VVSSVVESGFAGMGTSPSVSGDGVEIGALPANDNDNLESQGKESHLTHPRRIPAATSL
jgi:hypothetical protein